MKQQSINEGAPTSPYAESSKFGPTLSQTPGGAVPEAPHPLYELSTAISVQKRVPTFPVVLGASVALLVSTMLSGGLDRYCQEGAMPRGSPGANLRV